MLSFPLSKVELAPGMNIERGVSTVDIHDVISAKVTAGAGDDTVDKNMFLVDSAGDYTLGGDNADTTGEAKMESARGGGNTNGVVTEVGVKRRTDGDDPDVEATERQCCR